MQRAGKKSSLETVNYDIVFDLQDIEIVFKRKKIEAGQEAQGVSANNSEEKFNVVTQLSSALFKLGYALSKEETIVPHLIKSGYLWRAMQFLQYSMQREFIGHFKEFE